MRASVSSYSSYDKAGSNAQNKSVPHKLLSLILSVCFRYNAPSVVFLCLPALLAQPLRGVAVFCWQDVLQGVWCGWRRVASPLLWTHYFRLCLLFQMGNIWLMSSEIPARWPDGPKAVLTFPSLYSVEAVCSWTRDKTVTTCSLSRCWPLPLKFCAHVTHCFDWCVPASLEVWLKSNWQIGLGV